MSVREPNAPLPRHDRRRRFAIAAALALIPAAVLAQVQTGNVYGGVADHLAKALPGAMLTLSGIGAPQVQFADKQGQFRFVGLYPGTYRLECALDGFSPLVYESVVVNVNRNTTLALTMSPAIEEAITITAESPLLDARKVSTGATVDRVELEKIPTARDPWVILRTVPGVMLDRVNVGGDQSGQQGIFVGNGDDINSTWSLDGVEITDFGAIGGSPSYYDFDAFEEIQVSTGGSDAAARTGGVGINMVTKRGTNAWRGSGRYLVDRDSWQSSFDPSAGDFAKAGPWNQETAQTAFKQGNRIVSVADYGAELGGPILKDRLWIWGSYGKNDIRLLTVDDLRDNTLLETSNAKLNWQIAQNNSATFFFSDNEKTKLGRGASPLRPQETTWDQNGLPSGSDFFSPIFGDNRPTVAKLEDTHVFGSSVFVTASYAESDGGFQVIPEGGDGRDPATQVNSAWDESFIWRNTFLAYGSVRPQEQWKADASVFFSTGDLAHELKFGGNWRRATVRSMSFWPGFGIDLDYYTSYGYAYNIVQISREAEVNYVGKYENGYLQDTMTTGRLTANVGLRYDHQRGERLAATLDAVRGFEDILPAAHVPAADNNFSWDDISPRLGLTLALGEQKETLVRLSYSRFAEQLGGYSSSWANPGYPGAYVYEYFDDRNGDGHAQPDEVLRDIGILWTNGAYDPFDPSHPVQSYYNDPRLDAPVSDELVLGVERSLLPEFVVGLNATWRKESRMLEYERLVFDGDAYSPANISLPGRVHTADDYVLQTVLAGTLPDGSTYAVPVYTLRPGVTTRDGTLLTNGRRERQFRGLSATLNKRLSNRWMLRGNVSWNEWTWHVPRSELDGDPTPAWLLGTYPSVLDGDRVVDCGQTCISARWSYSFNALYQVAPEKRWGFDIAASVNGHEGYANPYWRRVGPTASGIGPRQVTVTGRPDRFTNPDVHVLDLRLEKEIGLGRVRFTLGLDCFNALNSGVVVERNLRLNTDNSDFVQRVVSPRIFRIGAKLAFD